MRPASGQPRLSHGLTLKGGQRFFNLPTRRRSCCSTSPLRKVDLVELVSPAISSVTEVPIRDAPYHAHRTPPNELSRRARSGLPHAGGDVSGQSVAVSALHPAVAA